MSPREVGVHEQAPPLANASTLLSALHSSTSGWTNNILMTENLKWDKAELVSTYRMCVSTHTVLVVNSTTVTSSLAPLFGLMAYFGYMKHFQEENTIREILTPLIWALISFSKECTFGSHLSISTE